YGADVFLSLHANSGRPGERGSQIWVHPAAGPSSRALARELAAALGGRGLPDAQVQAGPLAVLTPDRLGGEVAACLIEVDFLSDPEGERRLTDDRSMAALAQAIGGALARYGGTLGRGRAQSRGGRFGTGQSNEGGAADDDDSSFD